MKINGVTKVFGGIMAVREISFEVNKKEIVGLIGPNGAGKTTLVNMISGLIKPTSGNITFQNKNLVALRPSMIARYGIARTFQDGRIFKKMTVEENLAMGELYSGHHNSNRNNRDELMDILNIRPLANECAGNLPYGLQSLLGIGVALATGPSLLLMDEPLAGMSPQEVKEGVALIKKIRALGCAVLLIEHNIKAVMNVCDRIVVLNYGQKIGDGVPKDIQNDSRVIEAYLGVDINA